VLAMIAVATPAFASVNSSYIKIETTNSGSIDNTTKAKAETGGNWAGGSKGGRGGSAGDVGASSGDYNNGGATAGDGGDGGDADIGGTVYTGDAEANAGTANSLNTTDVDVDLGGEDMNSSKLKIETDNSDKCDCNEIKNTTKARARTGDNNAEGSKGGKGGSGGDVDVSGSGDNNNGGATAGDGGEGGKGDDGGLVDTGVSTANSGTINILNQTLVRVRL